MRTIHDEFAATESSDYRATLRRAVEAAKALGFPIASVGLRARVAFQESLWRGLGVLEFEPRGSAAAEINRLWSEVADTLWPYRVEQRGAAE